MRSNYDSDPSLLGGIGEEDGEIYELQSEPDTVDSDNKGAVRVNNRQPIQDPEGAVQHRRQVGVLLELPHRLVLDDLIAGWAAKKLNYTLISFVAPTLIRKGYP